MRRSHGAGGRLSQCAPTVFSSCLVRLGATQFGSRPPWMCPWCQVASAASLASDQTVVSAPDMQTFRGCFCWGCGKPVGCSSGTAAALSPALDGELPRGASTPSLPVLLRLGAPLLYLIPPGFNPERLSSLFFSPFLSFFLPSPPFFSPSLPSPPLSFPSLFL